MSRYDRPDPALDPAYCDALSPEPFDEDRADVFELGELHAIPAVPLLGPMPGYGLEVLRFLLAEDFAYGFVDDHGLQCADHSSLIAICSPDMCELSRVKISAVRMMIATVLANRANERRHENAVQPNDRILISPGSADDDSGGQLAPCPIIAPKPIPPPTAAPLVDAVVRF